MTFIESRGQVPVIPLAMAMTCIPLSAGHKPAALPGLKACSVCCARVAPQRMIHALRFVIAKSFVIWR
jgi:hypothetical protein